MDSGRGRLWASARTREEALADTAKKAVVPTPGKVLKKKCSWCRRPCVDGVVYTTLGNRKLLFHRVGRCLYSYKRFMGIGG